MAWLHAATTGLNGIQSVIAEKPWFFAIGLPVLVLTLGSTNYVIKRFSPLFNEHEKQKNEDPRELRWWREILRSFLFIFIPCYAIFATMVALSIIIFLMVGPFFYVGEKSAADAFSKGFLSSPTVRIQGDTDQNQYRLIFCSADFCALYLDGTTLAVKKELITKTEQATPKEKK